MVDIATQKDHENGSSPAILTRLGDRSIVLIGMMGVGKSSIGRRLGSRLGVPFVDADTEIERAAGMSIADIFARHGEAAFRSGEALSNAANASMISVTMASCGTSRDCTVMSACA